MTRIEIVEKLEKIVTEQLGCTSDCYNASMNSTWDELGADSLDMVELLMAIEEEYGLNINDDVAEVCNTPEKTIAAPVKHLIPAPSNKYIGVKLVEAVPMTAGAACAKGYKTVTQLDLTLGYEVTYPDGYKSWCPKAQFDEANRPCDAMPFGHAIEAAKKGEKIARKGWNGKNMFVVVMPALNLPSFNTQDTVRKVNDRTAKWIGADTPLNCVPYFAMYAANGNWVPGWLASQTDMLADDWMIVE